MAAINMLSTLATFFWFVLCVFKKCLRRLAGHLFLGLFPNLRTSLINENVCRVDIVPSCPKIQHSPARNSYINKSHGYSLLELTLALSVAAILILGINGLLNSALQAVRLSHSQNNALQQARFAMQQMVQAVAGSQRLMIPLGENPATAWSESVRDVLAVTLNPTLDRDKDGWADANNDEDFLDINNNTLRDNGEPERIDEDLRANNTNDNAPGIVGIDDNGDGTADNSAAADPNRDNDEDGSQVEDPINGIDDDNDGSVDEDITRDMNNDSAPGIAGVDDDYDGLTDEGGDNNDDDEDGLIREDWLDPVVFFLNGTTLMQRIPNINPIDGRDYGEYVIAENVSQFQVSRLSGGDTVSILVDITLTLSPPDTDPVTLNTQIRVGARL